MRFPRGEHLANGSPETQMTALKCVIEGSPFYCHDHNRPDWLCCGWVMMMLSREKDEPFGKMPWDFVTGADDAPPHPTDTQGNG